MSVQHVFVRGTVCSANALCCEPSLYVGGPPHLHSLTCACWTASRCCPLAFSCLSFWWVEASFSTRSLFSAASLASRLAAAAPPSDGGLPAALANGDEDAAELCSGCLRASWGQPMMILQNAHHNSIMYNRQLALLLSIGSSQQRTLLPDVAAGEPPVEPQLLQQAQHAALAGSAPAAVPAAPHPAAAALWPQCCQVDWGLAAGPLPALTAAAHAAAAEFGPLHLPAVPAADAPAPATAGKQTQQSKWSGTMGLSDSSSKQQG